MKRVRATAAGRVQGVGFRWSARSEAERLGISGYARNLPDGRVELEIQGDDTAVAAMLSWVAHGPPGARVDQVSTERLDARDAADSDRAVDDRGFEGFEIR